MCIKFCELIFPVFDWQQNLWGTNFCGHSGTVGTIIVRFAQYASYCQLIFVDKHKIHENLCTSKISMHMVPSQIVNLDAGIVKIWYRLKITSEFCYRFHIDRGAMVSLQYSMAIQTAILFHQPHRRPITEHMIHIQSCNNFTGQSTIGE